MTQIDSNVSLFILVSALGLDPAAGKTISSPGQFLLPLANQGDKGEWSAVDQLTNLITRQVFDLKNTVTKAFHYKLNHHIRTIINPRQAEDDGFGNAVLPFGCLGDGRLPNRLFAARRSGFDKI